MKLYKLVSFNEFYMSIYESELPIQLAYKLNKIYTTIEKDLNFYQTELLKIFEDCVEKDENNNYKLTSNNQNFVLKKDKINDFEKRFNDLRNIEINIENIEKINLNDLNNIKITPKELENLSEFLI